MRKHRYMRRYLSVWGIAVALVLGVGASASAAPKDDGVIEVVEFGEEESNGFGIGSGSRHCDVYSNPYPQYSASNKTVHFGGKIICNYTDHLYVVATLYRLSGSQSDPEYNWEDDVQGGATGSQYGNTEFTRCFAFNPTRWRLKIDATAASLGGTFGWTPIFTLPCSET